MIVLKVVCVSVASIAIMFVLTKLMGNKQMSELTMFDYINGITFGSIAAEMATIELDGFVKPLTAMITYAVIVTLISVLVNKSIKMRRLFSGKSVIIFDKGKLYKKNLSKVKIDINELLCQCRVNGFFNLDDIQTIVFESNGRLSILPKGKSRPLTPDDMGMVVNESSILASVIIDGKIMEENLKQVGKDKIWLDKELSKLGYSSAKKVFLGLVDDSNKLYTYDADENSYKNDIFQ